MLTSKKRKLLGFLDVTPVSVCIALRCHLTGQTLSLADCTTLHYIYTVTEQETGAVQYTTACVGFLKG